MDLSFDSKKAGEGDDNDDDDEITGVGRIGSRNFRRKDGTCCG